MTSASCLNTKEVVCTEEEVEETEKQVILVVSTNLYMDKHVRGNKIYQQQIFKYSHLTETWIFGSFFMSSSSCRAVFFVLVLVLVLVLA